MHQRGLDCSGVVGWRYGYALQKNGVGASIVFDSSCKRISQTVLARCRAANLESLLLRRRCFPLSLYLFSSFLLLFVSFSSLLF